MFVCRASHLYQVLSVFKDVTDLFGADLPVEGGEAGQFVWRDGPLLKALKAGHWVVLDEVCYGDLVSERFSERFSKVIRVCFGFALLRSVIS